MVCSKLLNTSQSQGFLAQNFLTKNLLGRISQRCVTAREREKQNIEYHYDVPSEFYRAFLGQTMGYTCGYYGSKDATMSDAQNEKMEIICKKLRLQKGERLLDIGCGWGNFAIYAAKHYHVRVKGITLSCEQKKYAEQWIHREGLDDQVRIDRVNYRDLGREKFDKISCVGMSEHVGRDNMKRFYQAVFNCLEEEGLFLQHTITTNTRRKPGYKNSFLDTFMFPGGELMQEQELIDLASGSGFELLTAENFRVHYIKTLADWIGRIEKNKAQLLKIVSENIYRVYHVFFIGSLVSFRQKEIALFQNLFYKSKSNPSSNLFGATWNYFLTPFSTIGPELGPETGSIKGSKDESERFRYSEV
jgi:cyclopropane-fatty-acyl-phospholipid synthase